MTTLVLDRADALADLEQRFSDGLADLREQVETEANGADLIDPDYVARWVETAKRLSVQLSNELPPQLDREAVAEIRGIIINLLAELEAIDPARPLDALDRFFVQSEAVRHIIRDALDEHVGCREDDARPLVAYMKQALPRVRQADQARIAGLSTRHFERLGKQGGIPPRQLVLAARLVKLLRYTWTPEGTIAWFDRKRAQLDGHAPINVMSEPGLEQTLLGLAREGRAQHAA